MAAIVRSFVSGYRFLLDEYADSRVNDFPLMGSPVPILVVILAYHYFVSTLGPRLMKDRPPLDMYYPMLLYNFLQIVINGVFVYKALIIVWLPKRYSFVCEPVDYSDNPVALEIAWYTWLYFIVKVLDLLDTVFMVLRKKDKQVTFLHKYHHIGMVITGWVATKYVAGGHSVFFGTVNSLVHTIMYCYYQVMLVKPEYKKDIWWKKHITEIQLVQFIVTTMHGLAALFNTNCGYPKYLLAFFIPQDVFMFFLFIDFYRKTYWSRKSKEEDKQS
ncbi:elongation of very long chain fatty acids protein AAEL008004-like [Homalodisca vitripennis]|uniref:elongation of very long chain fatty acids protein AAEL008004-like n=1 Tax=Homalodisca vitripennis TaxID=197043 RepID=UPI001EEA8AA1|nr:elongation of very long chain fatty acids protein AAEL008004-like [Homalodisca vitripennis]XP_046663616.1 elongation of very long chain fatty acids protein AAEL008004-like [Homalodisca vitripennis]